MSNRALDGLKLPPTTRREMERMFRDLQHEPEMTSEQLDTFKDCPRLHRPPENG